VEFVPLFPVFLFFFECFGMRGLFFFHLFFLFFSEFVRRCQIFLTRIATFMCSSLRSIPGLFKEICHDQRYYFYRG
jgi:hypothetical protein